MIDDIWETEAWDDMQICFPQECFGSRVLLTTRLTKVATHASSSSGVLYSMRTLSEKESWDLFYTKVFEKESYPCDEFEKIGKDIVMKCKGLPLAIAMISELGIDDSTLHKCHLFLVILPSNAYRRL